MHLIPHPISVADGVVGGYVKEPDMSSDMSDEMGVSHVHKVIFLGGSVEDPSSCRWHACADRTSYI